MARLLLKMVSWLAVAAIILIDVAQRRPQPHNWLPDDEPDPLSHGRHADVARKPLTRGT